jgi:hypothetical protein
MKMNQISVCFAATVLLLFTSCATLYKPNVVHSPLLKEKGEMHVAGALSLVGSANTNLQGAVALSENMGIMVNLMQHSRNRYYEAAEEKLRMFAGEAGIGYFKKLGKDGEFLFQSYGGFGMGRSRAVIENTSQSDFPEMSGKYLNFFIQPGIAYVSKHIDVAFDTRLNRVQMFDVRAYLYETFEWWNTDYTLYNDTTLSFAILEPTLTIKAGSPAFKGIFQLGATLPVYHPNEYYSVSSSDIFAPFMKMSIGIEYRFGTMKD